MFAMLLPILLLPGAPFRSPDRQQGACCCCCCRVAASTSSASCLLLLLLFSPPPPPPPPPSPVCVCHSIILQRLSSFLYVCPATCSQPVQSSADPPRPLETPGGVEERHGPLRTKETLRQCLWCHGSTVPQHVVHQRSGRSVVRSQALSASAGWLVLLAPGTTTLQASRDHTCRTARAHPRHIWQQVIACRTTSYSIRLLPRCNASGYAKC